MPKGNPTSRTLANDRYQKKIGLIVKGFKIYRSLADEFAEACLRKGESQAAAISRLMREYIDS